MKIKIAVLISILTFFIVATATLASYFVIKERNKESSSNTSDVTKPSESVNPAQVDTGLTSAKVMEHSTATDCWIIVDSKVYDVTKFLDQHPGGSFTITPYCGKDATNAFNSKDKNPAQKHTSFATSMLKDYFIGNLGESISTNLQTPTTTSKFITSTTKPVATNLPLKTTAPTTQTSSLTLSTAEVSTHSTSSNCWIIVSNNVYNVTNYLVSHPGGVSVITAYCGKDATGAFQSRGGTGSHSSRAYLLLSNYLVGSIGSTVTNTNNNTTTNPTTAPSNQSSNLPAAVLNKYPNATLKSIEDEGNEMQVNTSSGCRHIQLNSSGAIVSDQSC